MGSSVPSVDQAKRDVDAVIPDRYADDQDRLRKAQSALAAVQLEESRFLSLSRKAWSILLGICIVGSVLFQILLTIAVGLGWLDFTGYPGYLQVVAGATFAQIVGLSAIVLRWLFGGRRPDELLANKTL